MDEDELFVFAKQIQAPFSLVQEVAKNGRLPVVNFAAGGIATPADAALMMQLGVDGETPPPPTAIKSRFRPTGGPKSRAVRGRQSAPPVIPVIYSAYCWCNFSVSKRATRKCVTGSQECHSLTETNS